MSTLTSPDSTLLEPLAIQVEPPQDKAAAPVAKATQRLVSLDALRGFDMFWILGGEGLVKSVAAVWPIGPLRIAAGQLEHKRWEGFAAYDLIFPTFVFVMGVSLVFSLTKLIETRGRGAAIRRVIVRGVVLYVIGLLYYGGVSHGLSHLRLMGVLQRIALAYLFGGLMFCFFRPRTLALVCLGLLLSYWALLSFVPVPGVGHASFEEGKNLTNWIDARFLPFFKWDGDHDPEGLLSTLPATASCLLGAFAGLLLRATRPAPWKKVLLLIVLGAGALALGFYWGDQWPNAHVISPFRFPVIKKLWTSSFVLVAGGYSAILLGLFYLIIDVCKLRAWATPFVWIGTNAITLYVLERFVNYDKLARLFVGSSYESETARKVSAIAISVIAVAIMLSIARFLYKRQVFIRV
jgi:predicted acyltransferase